jgi:hypothetical protein
MNHRVRLRGQTENPDRYAEDRCGEAIETERAGVGV